MYTRPYAVARPRDRQAAPQEHWAATGTATRSGAALTGADTAMAAASRGIAPAAAAAATAPMHRVVVVCSHYRLSADSPGGAGADSPSGIHLARHHACPALPHAAALPRAAADVQREPSEPLSPTRLFLERRARRGQRRSLDVAGGPAGAESPRPRDVRNVRVLAPLSCRRDLGFGCGGAGVEFVPRWHLRSGSAAP